MWILLLNSQERDAVKAKNEELRAQLNHAQQSNSLSRQQTNVDTDKSENHSSLRNKNVEKHMTDLEDNIKNLNSLLMQERGKV